jgi:hypothetical protein
MEPDPERIYSRKCTSDSTELTRNLDDAKIPECRGLLGGDEIEKATCSRRLGVSLIQDGSAIQPLGEAVGDA